MEYDHRRPRLSKELGDRVDAARGQISFDAYVRTLVAIGLGAEQPSIAPKQTRKTSKTPAEPVREAIKDIVEQKVPVKGPPKPVFNRVGSLTGMAKPIPKSS